MNINPKECILIEDYNYHLKGTELLYLGDVRDSGYLVPFCVVVSTEEDKVRLYRVMDHIDSYEELRHYNLISIKPWRNQIAFKDEVEEEINSLRTKLDVLEKQLKLFR